MDEALDRVRRELGHDAIVVDSKEIATRRILPWPSTRQEIEICAQRASQSSSTRKSGRSHTKPVTVPRTIRTLAESKQSTVSFDTEIKSSSSIASESESANRSRFLDEELAPPPAWFDNQPNPESITADETSATVVESIASTPIAEEARSSEVAPHFESMASLVALLETHTRFRKTTDVPPEFAQHYSRLIDADIDEKLVHEMLAILPTASAFDETQSDVTSMLTAFVEREMNCASPIQPESDRREIVTVIGPTGVGKTTTIAKLAGHFLLNEGRRVGLIAVDHYRVGAIDQLRTYAEILQAPIRCASTPDELRVAIDSLDNVDVILIDTAGRSPQDGPKLNELGDLLNVAQSDHVLLVLSLAGGAKNLQKIAGQFAFARPTSLVVSKLDEAVGCGGLLSITREISVPISYVTTGQDVPSQIEPANPNRLARLVLGSDQLTH
jgi:flagellar biosynthesis protein FlhF